MFSKKTFMTNENGVAVNNDKTSLKAKETGDVLLRDVYLHQKLRAFNRERIPERVVHAKGAGAHGYFKVTKNMNKYCCAKFLSRVGKKTDIFARFSTVGGPSGSSDYDRDPRGFALKFYTEHGNYDIVGNNTPIFFIREAIKFPDFIHSQKKNPQSNCPDANIFWDFISLNPETAHQVVILFSDRGIPANHRQMHGFGSHTFKWYNSKGEYFWIKYHFKTNQGIDNITNADLKNMADLNPDGATKDLFNAIKEKNYPSWTCYVQIMTQEEADECDFDIFDITKVWSQKDYPLQEFGVFTLNRNVEDYFCEVEQAAFSPANFVAGIAPSPDPLLQGRLFAYQDAHLHRLGPNYIQIPINHPKNVEGVHNYSQNGVHRHQSIHPVGVNYYPNSMAEISEDKTSTHAIEPPHCIKERKFEVDDFSQAHDLYANVMTLKEQHNFQENVIEHLKGVTDNDILIRTVELFYNIDHDLGKAIAKNFNIEVSF
ncbi:catalase [Lentisphaerota bacterium WC36G]|nr:catalase [Lentisphaerae bacterium WC36]